MENQENEVMENQENKANVVEVATPIEAVATEAAKVLIIEQGDLAQINKNRAQEQQILAAIGMLETKKVEMIAQIGQLKRNLEDAIKFSLSKIGIEEQNFINYAINPTTGEVIKKQV
jgi:hypothetical protein